MNNQMIKAFEAWYRKENPLEDMSKASDGDYVYMDVQMASEYWKASWNACLTQVNANEQSQAQQAAHEHKVETINAARVK